jgi:hypothetical protein
MARGASGQLAAVLKTALKTRFQIRSSLENPLNIKQAGLGEKVVIINKFTISNSKLDSFFT